MAPKLPIENLPPVSSSDDEEDPSEEDDSVQEGVDDEETEDDATVVKPKIAQQNSASDSEDDSENTIPSPNVSDFTIKPIVNHSSPSPARKLGSKRLSQADPIQTGSKKNKTNASYPSTNHGDGGYSKKGLPIQRLWSEEDEISILEGMHEFRTEKETDPFSDTSAFYDFIKKSLHIEASKNQLVDKMRKLKQKYVKNADKVAISGKKSVISKPHEIKCFELSRKIWGDVKKIGALQIALGSPTQDGGAEKMVSKRDEEDSEENDNVSSETDDEDDSEMVVTENETEREMDGKWRNLKVKALELYIKKIDLEMEEAKLVLEAMKLKK